MLRRKRILGTLEIKVTMFVHKYLIKEHLPICAKSEPISTTDLVNMITSFCELYTGMEYYVYQKQYAKRIIRSVLENDGAEITSLFARQMGKLI